MFNRKPTKKNKSTIDLTKIGEWIGNGIGGKVGFSPRRLRELEKWISEREKEDEKKVSYYRQFESLVRGAYCLRYGITISDLEMLIKLKND